VALSRSYRRDKEDERDGGRIKGRHMAYDNWFFRVLASLDPRRAVNAERHTKPYLEISKFQKDKKRQTDHTQI
jgi:hypothetical protein